MGIWIELYPSNWWTWVWVNSGSWWWTGRPGVLRFTGSQRVGHGWVTELNWNLFLKIVKIKIILQWKNSFHNQFNREEIQANSKIIFLYILIKHSLRNKSYNLCWTLKNICCAFIWQYYGNRYCIPHIFSRQSNLTLWNLLF